MILTRAPLRLSLGGGGTDLPSYANIHGGFIVSAAIDKYVYICLNRPASDDLLRLKYSRYEEVREPLELAHDLVGPALELVGVRKNVEIASLADVPAGTGLGSSAAYLVAVLLALHELKRERVSTQALAEEASHVEIDLAGHPVGKQDHYLAAFGGLTCLDIQPGAPVRVTPLAIGASVAEELRDRLLLFFTGIRRDARDILGDQRADTERGDARVLASLHRTKELGRAIRDALESGELDRFGELMHEHWQAKKDRSGKVSAERIDRAYDDARRAGATGGKLVGAGGGGFLMLYCPEGSKQRVREAVAAHDCREMSYRFDHEGAKALVSL